MLNYGKGCRKKRQLEFFCSLLVDTKVVIVSLWILLLSVAGSFLLDIAKRFCILVGDYYLAFPVVSFDLQTDFVLTDAEVVIFCCWRFFF